MLTEERIAEIRLLRRYTLNRLQGLCQCAHCQAIDNLLAEREECLELCAALAKAFEVSLARYPDKRRRERGQHALAGLPDAVKARMEREEVER